MILDNLEQHKLETTLLSIFYYNLKEIEVAVKYGLTKTDFYSSQNQFIFSQLLVLHNSNLEVDDTLILKDAPASEKELLLESLLEIYSCSISSSPIHYIDKLKENNSHRSLQIELKKLLNPDLAYNELVMKLSNIMDNKKTELSNSFSIKPLHDAEDLPIKTICNNFLKIPLKAITKIIANGDSGKTFLALMILLNYKLEQIKNQTYKKAFGWFSEDSIGEIKKREKALLKICFNEEDRALLLDEKYKDILYYTDQDSFKFLEYEYKNLKPSNNFYKMKNALKDFELLIYDPLASFTSTDENDNGIATEFMSLILNWIMSENKAAVFLHHTPHKKEKGRGAEAYRDKSKLIYMFEPSSNNGKDVTLIVNKDNYFIYGKNTRLIRPIFPIEQQNAPRKIVK